MKVGLAPPASCSATWWQHAVGSSPKASVVRSCTADSYLQHPASPKQPDRRGTFRRHCAGADVKAIPDPRAELRHMAAGCLGSTPASQRSSSAHQAGGVHAAMCPAGEADAAAGGPSSGLLTLTVLSRSGAWSGTWQGFVRWMAHGNFVAVHRAFVTAHPHPRGPNGLKGQGIQSQPWPLLWEGCLQSGLDDVKGVCVAGACQATAALGKLPATGS